MSKRAFKIRTDKAKPFKLTGRTKSRSIIWTAVIAVAAAALIAFGLFQGLSQVPVRHEIELGAQALSEGNFPRAESLARRAVHRDTLSEDAQLLLATVLARQGRYEEAIEPYRRANRLGRENAMSHLGLGVALEGAGRRPEAIAEFRRAVFLDSAAARGHYHLGMALAAENYRAEAIKELEKFLRLSPQAPEKAGVDSVLEALKK